MDVLDVQEVLVAHSFAPQVDERRQLVDVVKEPKVVDLLSLALLFDQLFEIIETLLSHHGVVTFISDLWRIIFDQIRKPRPG